MSWCFDLKTVRDGRVQAVFFDLDQTLVDRSKFRETVVQTCNQLAASTGLDSEELIEANGNAWKSYETPEVEEKWTLGALSSKDVNEEVWRRTLLALGQDDERLVEQAWQTNKQNRRKTLRLFDDSRETINSLKHRFRLAVITNGASDSQRETLQLFDIEQMFDAVLISGEIGAAKPDPRLFTLALQKLGVEKENAWDVGDSLDTDVAGALKAGVTAVWLNRTGIQRRESDPKPDYEIRSLSELTTLVSIH